MDSMEWIAPDGVTRVEYQVPREEHLLAPMESAIFNKPQTNRSLMKNKLILTFAAAILCH